MGRFPEYRIRQAGPKDLDQVYQMEILCFPQAEAASRESLEMRIRAFPESFLVADAKGKLLGMVNGCVTDSRTICDEMFSDPSFHKPDGAYQAIFGLDVLPEFRRQGIGGDLMGRLAGDAGKKGRKGLILTCKEKLIHYYERFGYRNLGISRSVHGGAVWYDMILEIDEDGDR